MELQYAQQINNNELEKITFDAVFVASGYETRATFLAQNKLFPSNTQLIAFAFNDRKKNARKTNDKIFKDLGYKIIDADGDTDVCIIQHIDKLLSIKKKQIKILIDISCMTRVWYAGIISHLKNKKFPQKEIEIFFSYSFATYTKPTEPKPNTYMGPISGFCSIDIPDKKTALILGLGYEPNRAQGLYEYIEPAETYAFYTDPSLDNKFVKNVLKNNNFIFDSFEPNNIYKYPIMDLRRTDALLTSLCLDLRKKYRVILAPLGPKPFILLCLLVAAKYNDIDVWRVSSGITGDVLDRKASGEILVCKSFFFSNNPDNN